jgi:hypothetical protein
MSFHYCVNKINVYGALVHVAWILDLYMLIYASHCSPVVLIDVFFSSSLLDLVLRRLTMTSGRPVVLLLDLLS